MSFLRSVTQLTRGRDTALKHALLNNLSECVKDIQYHSQFEENFTSVLGAGDATSALCAALEAILLHGLKDTLLRKARNALADPERRPQPDFWPLVLVVSHRQSVEHISALPHITTQIGQCRAWLRAALNDCLLSSYLAALLRNNGAVKPFYARSAFACDAEALELAQRLVEGLESCVQFNVPVNSSLLNDWPESVLMLAGVWVPTLREMPISAGLDVASTLRDDAPAEPLARNTLVSASTLGRALALDEDEALNFILKERPEDAIRDARRPLSTPPPSPPISSSPPLDDFVEPSLLNIAHETQQIALSDNTEVFNDDNYDPILLDNVIINVYNDTAEKEPTAPQEDHPLAPDSDSLSSLAGGDDAPDLRNMMRDIHAELRLDAADERRRPASAEPTTAKGASPEDPILRQLGFEIIPTSPSSFSSEEATELSVQLGRLSREFGLDSQNYQCRSCQDLLGGGASKARVCALDGKYYCGSCMDSDVFVIPARVIHNWDFRRYAVSRRAARYLLEVQHRPLLDVRRLNPRVYAGVADMAALRELRVQLNLLRAYAATCREPVASELQRMVWPREYLYEQVHAYAPADLAQIPSGSLAATLQRVVTFARAHVLGCWLCSQKGFICEVCRAPDPLYPFDTSATFRCERCCGVFHASCLHAGLPCPKCHRRRLRVHSAASVQSLHR